MDGDVRGGGSLAAMHKHSARQFLAGVMQDMMPFGRTEMAVKGIQETQMYDG